MEKINFKILILICTLHFIFAFYLSANLNIWIDEAYSLRSSSNNIYNTIKNAIFFEDQPPFYFILLYYWKKINDQIFFARLLSIIFSTASVTISYFLSKIFLKNISPLWLPLFVAFHPLVVFVAVEIRLYALVVFFSALLIFLFFKSYINEKNSKLFRASYIFCIILSVYTHYFLSLIPGALFAAIMLSDRRNKWKVYVKDMLLVGLFVVPLLGIIFHQLNRIAMESQASTGAFQKLIALYWVITEYIVPLWDTGQEASRVIRLWIVRFILFLCLTISVIFRKDCLKNESLSLFIVFSVLLCFFVVIVQILPEDLVKKHHLIELFLPSLLLFLYCIKQIPFKITRNAILTTLFICNLCVSLNNYPVMAKKGDWQRVAKFIEINETEGENIYLFPLEGLIAIKYYYKGMNRLYSIPSDIDDSVFSIKNMAIKNSEHLSSTLGKTELNKKYWLVTSGPSKFFNIDFGYSILEKYINLNFISFIDKEFFGSRVRMIQRIQ